MLGLMQDHNLLISSIILHAARHHGEAMVVSKTVEGDLHRMNYVELERRSRRLARALIRFGISPGDRVATLAWNSGRHLELYYGVSGMQAVCHTINPRLSPADIGYIVNHAGDVLLFADTTFAPLVAACAPAMRGSVRAVVFMTERAHMPDIALPEGMDLLCYEELMAASDEDYAWPDFDERTAASLCYTSGTTGKPKGVLYSHRSTLLHAYGVNLPDVMGLRTIDKALPVVPMFHVNAWGIPYAAPMAGAGLVMPGRHLDGASLTHLMNSEGVTFSAGVPTVWMGLLNYLKSSGERLTTVNRMVIGGSACPRILMEEFGDTYGIRIDHAWGMSEMSPLGTYNSPKAQHVGLDRKARLRLAEKQGRAVFGVDMRIVGDAGTVLPWDGKTSGHLQVKGPWVTSAYFGEEPGSALDAEGWFATGDVATIDPEGYMEITDRSKDVIKSGGEWISSIQLENIAVGHPDVMEAAIIAARHEKWDERPLLIVVPRKDHEIDRDSLIAFYEGKVAKWWTPDDVVVVSELPHTATGKIQKLALRDTYRDHLLPKS
jgi:acyl-CoA synthetase (AMP-forming)/AMP-acid ligase II